MTLPCHAPRRRFAFVVLLPLLFTACGGGEPQAPQHTVPSIQGEDTVRLASTAAPLPAPAAAMTPGSSHVIPAPIDAPRRTDNATRPVADTPSAASPAACTLPRTIDPPAVRRPDQRNIVRTDSLMLVLSWSPTFCAAPDTDAQRRHAVQCRLNDFGFVVHGLWPQSDRAQSTRDHPRHCRGSDPLPVALVRRHLCTVPGADLMQNEWQAHGTCHWSRPEDYFATIESLWARFQRPAMQDLPPEMTAGDLKRAFVSLNAGTLKQEHLQVTVASGNRLRDVRICLTADATPAPRPCPRGGTPDRQRVQVVQAGRR